MAICAILLHGYSRRLGRAGHAGVSVHSAPAKEKEIRVALYLYSTPYWTTGHHRPRTGRRNQGRDFSPSYSGIFQTGRYIVERGQRCSRLARSAADRQDQLCAAFTGRLFDTLSAIYRRRPKEPSSDPACRALPRRERIGRKDHRTVQGSLPGKRKFLLGRGLPTDRRFMRELHRPGTWFYPGHKRTGECASRGRFFWTG